MLRKLMIGKPFSFKNLRPKPLQPQISSILEVATLKTRDNPETVIEISIRAPNSLQYASKRLRGDKETILAIVSRKGEALQFASTALKSDKEIALAAVNSNGTSIQHVAIKLKSDRELAIAAISQTPLAAAHIKQFLFDEQFIIDVFARQPTQLLARHIYNASRAGEQFILEMTDYYKFPNHTYLFAKHILPFLDYKRAQLIHTDLKSQKTDICAQLENNSIPKHLHRI